MVGWWMDGLVDKSNRACLCKLASGCHNSLSFSLLPETRPRRTRTHTPRYGLSLSLSSRHHARHRSLHDPNEGIYIHRRVDRESSSVV